MDATATTPKETAQRFSLSLYPKHIRTIRQFAAETDRSDSNALQFIVEDWARMKRAAIHAAAIPEPAP